VLEVVQQQEGGLARERGRQLFHRLDLGQVGQAQHVPDPVWDQARVRQVLQRDEPDGAPERLPLPHRHFERQARLPAAAGPGERHQPGRAGGGSIQQRQQPIDLFFAAEEAGEARGEATRRVRRQARGWERLRAPFRVVDLEQALRHVSAEAVAAQIEEAHSDARIAPQQAGGALGDEDLPPMGGQKQRCGMGKRGALVRFASRGHFARMHRHAQL
jgi:hypothetical protein